MMLKGPSHEVKGTVSRDFSSLVFSLELLLLVSLDKSRSNFDFFGYSQRYLIILVLHGVNNTSEAYVTGVVDTGEEFLTSVNDTGSGAFPILASVNVTAKL
jgi:hypothetical protein